VTGRRARAPDGTDGSGGPGARLTVYLSQEAAEHIDRESRRLHYAFGGVSRSRLVGALVDVGFAHFGEVETAMQKPANGRTRRSPRRP
jgi:hypothetical protein